MTTVTNHSCMLLDNFIYRFVRRAPPRGTITSMNRWLTNLIEEPGYQFCTLSEYLAFKVTWNFQAITFRHCCTMAALV